MPPVVLAVDPGSPAPDLIARAVNVLQAGGLVAFPTDTLYALGADATNPAAVGRVFAAKGRQTTRALPVLVMDAEMAGRYAEVTAAARRLMDAFWPGPLTLILRGTGDLPEAISGSGEGIGLRAPNSPTVLALLGTLGRPIIGTSANRTGGPDPRTAREVSAQLGDLFDLLLDGGPTPVGRPSTVVDLTGDPPRFVRVGAIPEERVREKFGSPHP